MKILKQKTFYKKVVYIFFVFLFIFAVSGATHTRAALTETQMNAIITLLQSFGVPQGTIDAVRNLLDSSNVSSNDNTVSNVTTSNATTQNTTVSCKKLRFYLYKGVSDARTRGEVSLLQNQLRYLGYYDYPEITGYFGVATEKAVKAFQCDKLRICDGNLYKNGFGAVGPMTSSALYDACINALSRPISAPEFAISETVNTQPQNTNTDNTSNTTQNTCTLEDGTEVPDGYVETRIRYEKDVVPNASECKSEQQQRVCRSGSWTSWSGSFLYTSCSVSKNYNWVTGNWRMCVNKKEKRDVFCQDENGNIVNDSFCDSSTRPADSRDCANLSSPCASGKCLRFVVGRPYILRKSPIQEADMTLSAFKKKDGLFRVFTANQESFAIDTNTLYNLQNKPATKVLGRGPKGSDSECGNWISDILPYGNELYAIVHKEKECNYAIKQTNMGSDLYKSSDDGLSWTKLGALTDNTQETIPGTHVGIGGGNAIKRDGFVYVYALKTHPTGWKTILFGTKEGDFDPKSWKKWDGNGFNADMQSGAGDIGVIGYSAGYLKDKDTILLLRVADAKQGISIFTSNDVVNFAALDEPLILYGGRSWSRPSDYELVSYPAILDPNYGTRNVSGNRFLFTYTYYGPQSPSDNRYIIGRDVYVSEAASPDAVHPRVKIALSRWRDAQSGNRWTTTHPPAIADKEAFDFVFEKNVGYLTTAPIPGKEADMTQLKECVKDINGKKYFMLAWKESGRCVDNNYTELQTNLGWIHKKPAPGTVPVYSCKTTIDGRYSQFLSTDSNCESLGTKEFMLGYIYPAN